MNRDEIIRMAREAGFAIQGDMYGEDDAIAKVERFAALVAAAEREECAKVCDKWVINRYDTNLLSAAIRAKGQQ
jgi:hypothetical protein